MAWRKRKRKSGSYCFLTWRSRPPTRVGGGISRRSDDTEPKYCPLTLAIGEPPPVVRWKIAVRASGAWGTRSCHAASAALAADHGQLMLNHAAPRARWVLNVKLVTMPKLPPPPPRHA